MKIYVKANDDGLYRQLGITADDFKIIKDWCDSYDPDSDVAFEFNDMSITNPFLDPTGRFELSLAEAIKTYGLDNVKQFCKAVLSVSNGLYEILIASMFGDTFANPGDEWDVVSLSKGFTETGITSYDLAELKSYLSQHQLSAVKNKSGRVVCDVALISVYDTEIGDYNCVAYQTYDGEVVDE